MFDILIKLRSRFKPYQIALGISNRERHHSRSIALSRASLSIALRCASLSVALSSGVSVDRTRWASQLGVDACFGLPELEVDVDQFGRAKRAGSIDEFDELYGEALEFAQSRDEVSISCLQRHLRIGFNRSARLIDQLEREGIVAPAQGSKPRKVL